MVNRRIVLIVLLVAAFAGAATAWLAMPERELRPALEQATWLDSARPLPDLALMDGRGRDFRQDQLRGHWTLMFFGFTNCPDVCPTTLAALAAVRRQLADLPTGEMPAVVFVSVYPGRDTPEALGRYVAHFDPQFAGVTGTPAAIETLTRALGVAVFIGAAKDDGSYAVDHTAAIFLIDPDAALRAVFSGPHLAAAIAGDYRRIVAAAH